MNLTEILNRDRLEAIVVSFPKALSRFLADPLLRKERAPTAEAPASLEQLGTGIVILSLVSIVASGVRLFSDPDLPGFVVSAIFTPIAISVSAVLGFVSVVVLGFKGDFYKFGSIVLGELPLFCVSSLVVRIAAPLFLQPLPSLVLAYRMLLLCEISQKRTRFALGALGLLWLASLCTAMQAARIASLMMGPTG